MGTADSDAETETDDVKSDSTETSNSLHKQSIIAPEAANVVDALSIDEKSTLTPRVFPQDPPPTPKIASDVFEALLGAVFLDSNLDLEAVWRVVDNALLLTKDSKFNSADELPVVGESESATARIGSSAKPFVDWIHQDTSEALYTRLHPIRKWTELLERFQCRGAVTW
jgi:hypothetical protein